MKVVITGAAGQLGTHVLMRLIADPKIREIVCIDLKKPRLKSAKLRIAQYDIRDSRIQHAMMGADAVIHLAFVVTDYLPKKEFFDINLEGSKNVFQAAVNAGAGQIIYTSSIVAYGLIPGHPEPIVEDTPRYLQTDLQYAAAKYFVEEYLDTFEQEHKSIIITRLRPAIMLGEEMDHTFGHALRHRVLFKVNETPIPIVWDEDVADAVLSALHKRAAGAFNLASDLPLNPEEWAEVGAFKVIRLPDWLLRAFARMSILVGRNSSFRVMDPAWFMIQDVRMTISSEKARKELDWQPMCNTAADVVRQFVSTLPDTQEARVANTQFEIED